MLENYLPVLIQLGTATSFAVVTLFISVLLGKSAKRNKMKDSAYECGMLPIGEAQPPLQREVLHRGHALCHF